MSNAPTEIPCLPKLLSFNTSSLLKENLWQKWRGIFNIFRKCFAPIKFGDHKGNQSYTSNVGDFVFSEYELNMTLFHAKVTPVVFEPIRETYSAPIEVPIVPLPIGENREDVEVMADDDYEELKMVDFELGRELVKNSNSEIFAVRLNDMWRFDPRFCNHELNLALKVQEVPDQRSRDRALNETFIHKLVSDHCNIANYFTTFSEFDCQFIVMEHVHGMNLGEKLNKFGRFNEKEGVQIIRQVFDALTFMHERNCCHLDIKPGNLMLEENNDQGYPTVKVIDFGIAYRGRNVFAPICSSRSGTVEYGAPEVTCELKYSPASADIWSAGIVFYEMLCGKPPYNGKTQDEVLQDISEGESPFKGMEWEHLSGDVRTLLMECLRACAEQRPKARDVKRRISQILGAEE